MGMIILAISLLFAASAAPAATSAEAEQAHCPDTPTLHMARPGKGALLRKLNDLPPGQAFAAVYRRDERGCIVRVLYSERYSGPKVRAAAPSRQRR